MQVLVKIAAIPIKKPFHVVLSFFIESLAFLKVDVAIRTLVLEKTQRIGLVVLVLHLELGLSKLGTRGQVTSLNFVGGILPVVTQEVIKMI